MAPISRPDTKTQFHIDLDWFAQNGRDLREEMHALLCDECRSRYPTLETTPIIDRIHRKTAEVTRVDALWECLADHCGRLPTYITPATPLTIAIFRALLANGNNPMTPEQLHRRINKNNAPGILRVLLSAEVENGVVPVEDAS